MIVRNIRQMLCTIDSDISSQDHLAILPCNPTFLDARAGFIQADVDRFNGVNACTLWTAFASMGMGPDAQDGVDDFNVPASCGGTGSEVASTGDGSDAAGTAGTSTTGGNTGNGGNGNGNGRRRGGRRGRGRNNGFQNGHKH